MAAGAAGAFVASRRETTGYPCLALAMALTTLPENDGCRSPKKLMPRPSGRTDISTCTALRLGDSLRLDGLPGLHPRPGTSGHRATRCSDLRGREPCWAAFPPRPEWIARAADRLVRTGQLARGFIERAADQVNAAAHPYLSTSTSSRRQAFGETHAFFERLRTLLRDSACSWAHRSAAAIGDGDAAPGIQQLDEIRPAAFASGRRALGANRAGVRR